ncbi:MAG: beta-ketoacyl-ACP synthase III [Anaerovoracaceae bacterium]|nr:beta-ketoacyl-ACP synthase III [Anaerovoracaceae bacterium]
MGIEIKGYGKALPEMILTNKDMEKIIETDNQWIVDRTGIENRHVAIKETNLDLASEASLLALGDVDPQSIDLVIVSTITPDRLVPSMGSLLKMRLGLTNAVAFDLNAACSGFIFAAWTAEALMKHSNFKRALIVGAECLTKITNWEDRTTCVLFGDGAGAALMEENPDRPGILSSYIKNYDDPKDVLPCGIEYRKRPFDKEVTEAIDPMYISMKGQQVFKFAVNALDEVMEETINRANLTYDDIAFFVPHQANMRIINAAAQKTKQAIEKFQISIKDTGNVSSASVPMALYDLMQTGKVKKGDKIMLMGFGGGLSAGAMIYEV